MATAQKKKAGKSADGPIELVNLTIRIHREARKQLRIRAAQEERNIEDIVRDLVYPKIGMGHLSVQLKPVS